MIIDYRSLREHRDLTDENTPFEIMGLRRRKEEIRRREYFPEIEDIINVTFKYIGKSLKWK